MPIFRHPLRDRLAAKLVADSVAAGADQAKAEMAVADLASDHPLIDLLTKFDWGKLIDLVMKLITLLG